MLFSSQVQSVTEMAGHSFKAFKPLFFCLFPMLVALFLVRMSISDPIVSGFGVADSGFSLVLHLIAIVFTLYIYTASLICAYGSLAGEADTIKQSWSLARGRCVGVLFCILRIAVVYGAYAGIVALMFLIQTILLPNMVGLWILIALSAVVIYKFVSFMLRACLAVPIAAIHGYDPKTSIKVSKDMLAGSKVTKAIGVIFLVVILPHIVLAAIGTIVIGGLFDANSGIEVVKIFTIILSCFVINVLSIAAQSILINNGKLELSDTSLTAGAESS